MSDVFTEIGWQDIHRIVGEGKLSPTEVLAACNAIMRERFHALAKSPAAPPPSDVGEIVAFARACAAQMKKTGSRKHIDGSNALETFADMIEAGDYRPAKEASDEA